VAGVGRVWLRLVVWLNAHLKSAAVRLTSITGKSPVPLHPKHLLESNEAHSWYLPELRSGDRLLDIGCGGGTHAVRAVERVAQAVGLDYAPGALQMAQRIAAERGSPGLIFLQASAEASLPFDDGTFDIVLLLDVIEHLHNRVSPLKEIRRVLQPEGRLLLSAPNRNTTWRRQLKAAGLPDFIDADHKIEYTLDELLAELAAGGFEAEGQPQVIVYDTRWAGLIDLMGGLSLSLYHRLVMWKVRRAQAHPEETTGWRIVCRKQRHGEHDERGTDGSSPRPGDGCRRPLSVAESH
jgi:SAM-dependent methyltransferase